MSINFVCIASGPSLTRSDCLLAVKSGFPIIAVNSSWSLVPECQHIFAGDYAWWDKHHDKITSPAKRWTVSPRANILHSVNLMDHAGGAYNSGQLAIKLAAQLGAERVILLGYDCSLSSGIHWHGAHGDGLDNPDAAEVNRWHSDFASLRAELAGIEIINASRHTELTCFPISTPEITFNAR